MSSRQQKPVPAPRLYLVTPAIEDAVTFARKLTDALGAADIAAVLLRFSPEGESALIKRAKVLVPVVQNSGAAAILDHHADFVGRCGADGAHLTGLEAFKEAAEALKPDRIAGAGGLVTRHDAMLAAEAGADYILFGGADQTGLRPAFDAVIDRIAWWAELFESPCVGLAESFDEVAPLAAAGADFVALGDWLWRDARGAAGTVAAASGLLSAETIT